MRFKPILTAAAFVCALAGLLATSALAQPRGTVPADTVPICANCHESQHLSIMLTAHGARNDAQGSMCQSCHGDASAHLRDPMKAKPPTAFKKGVPAAAKDAVCMNCHAGNRHLVFWESGKHVKNEVSCYNCHNIHGSPGQPRPVPPFVESKGVSVEPFTTSFRPNEAEVCGGCHQQIRAATYKPSHHPITENKIKCSDCHNPHGALTPVMLRAETINQQCYSCHPDKRGPFVFGHPPVETNCVTCHNPHGSVYARLLNEKVPNLCQDCHDVARHPGTPYGAAAGFACPEAATKDPTNAACFNKVPGAFNTAANTRFIARSCLNCHGQIHGSNAPGNRGQFFIR